MLGKLSEQKRWKRKTGINDYLTGKERPIRFNVLNMNEEAEIVQSLAML
jgi:asparagine synthetase A